MLLRILSAAVVLKIVADLTLFHALVVDSIERVAWSTFTLEQSTSLAVGAWIMLTHDTTCLQIGILGTILTVTAPPPSTWTACGRSVLQDGSR